MIMNSIWKNTIRDRIFIIVMTAALIFSSFPLQEVQAKTTKYAVVLEGAGYIYVVESIDENKISYSQIYSGDKVSPGTKIYIEPLEETDERKVSDIQVVSGKAVLTEHDGGAIFDMPKSDVRVKVVYSYTDSDSEHRVIVSGGSQGTGWYGVETIESELVINGEKADDGKVVRTRHYFYPSDGYYTDGQKIYLEADTLYTAKKRFKKWEVVSGNVKLKDENAFFTSFIMPDSDVKIKAVYETIPKNGTKFTYKGNMYKVTYLQCYRAPEVSGVVEVTFLKAKKGVKNLVIPPYVFYKGVKCEVTTLDDNCISESKKLTSVSIPSTVCDLGDGTFKGCTNLKKVVLKHTKDVESLCCFCCGPLRNISKKAVVYVDKKCLKQYQKYMYKTGLYPEPVIDKTTKIKAIK